MTTIIRNRAGVLALALLGALLCMPAASARAQSAVITGKVTTESGQPVEAANLYINELAVSIGTNAAGNYTVTIPGARVSGQKVNLRIRAIGHQSQLRLVTIVPGAQTQNFTLQSDVNRLSEVVVTGVVEGTERSKVPFAVGRVTSEDLPIPALDPIKALAGKVAGLRIAQTSGQPGTSPEIQLRGPTSINATGRGDGPLIIVDGAIMNVGSLAELGGLDIESAEVVKGAAGASLYGTRAANGVITIRTKRGASGSEGIKFSARSEYGISDLNSLSYGQPINHQVQLDETGKRFCVSGASNIAPCSRTFNWMQEILRINNVATDTLRTPQSGQYNAPGVTSGDLQNVYQAQIWPTQYYNMLAQSVSRNPVTLNSMDATGKVAGVRFFASGSYQNEQGAITGLRGNQQARARVNLDYDVRSDLTISTSTLFDKGTNDNRNGGGGGGSIFGQLMRGASAGTDYVRRDTLGRYLVRSGGASLHTPTGNGGGTFLYNSENQYDQNDSYRFLGNLTARYFPKDWVTVDGTFAYDNRQQLNENYLVKGYRTFTTNTAQNSGQLGFGNTGEASYTANLTATLRKQLRNDLNGKLQFRGLYDNDVFNTNASSGQIFTVKDVYTSSNLQTNKAVSSSGQTITNVGMSGGASLDFKDRYVIDGTLRRDGSSLFGSGNRWANFGRISGVWRVSEEPFWKFNALNDFRLRASHGTAGSTPRFSAQYETYNCGSTGCSLGQAGNSKLQPETTTENEFGTDFTLFNRLGVELTKADSRTRNQILLVNTPSSLGFAQQWQNAGSLDNHTYEVGLNLPLIDKKDLSWSMRGTWDRTRTFISELFTSEFVYDGGTSQGTSSFFHITANPALSCASGFKDAQGVCSQGYAQNRFGSIWGRRFYTSCDQMAVSLQAQCGEGQMFQANDKGYIVYVGAGNTTRDGITKNLWETILPGTQSPFGDNVPLYWGMPIVDRPLRGQPGQGNGINQIIGNAMPNFRFTYSNNISYKRVTLYGLLDGTVGQDVYNQGEGWGILDFSSAYFDAAGQTVETAKPVGYDWRGGPSESTGIGGLYDVLGPNTYTVERASFAKIREMSITYKVGPVARVGDWTVGLIGRNLKTFTNYSGLDPEVGATSAANGGSSTNASGSGLLNATDAFGFPTLRTFTISLSTRF
ncbi:MAG: SusC/RagA family TonB-linked outer membrane protein [bacterium]